MLIPPPLLRLKLIYAAHRQTPHGLIARSFREMAGYFLAMFDYKAYMEAIRPIVEVAAGRAHERQKPGTEPGKPQDPRRRRLILTHPAAAEIRSIPRYLADLRVGEGLSPSPVCYI